MINAVTKSGTNSFSGAVFGFFTGTKVTSRNYFTSVNDQPEPSTGKDDGAEPSGTRYPKQALLLLHARTGHAGQTPGSHLPDPAYSYSKSTDESAWNTLWRIDHQVDQNNTWAFRWLREYAPQFNVIANQETLTSNDDETDLERRWSEH